MDGGDLDKRRLMMYEKSKLRYYYAVVEFDCVASAHAVYNECDGMELEGSATKFDLRWGGLTGNDRVRPHLAYIVSVSALGGCGWQHVVCGMAPLARCSRQVTGLVVLGAFRWAQAGVACM